MMNKSMIIRYTLLCSLLAIIIGCQAQHYVSSETPMELGYIQDHPVSNFTADVVADAALSRFADDSVSNLVNAVGLYAKLNHSITWRHGLQYCESVGKRLCMRKDYCRHGAGKPPRPGLQDGEAWAPTSDGFNTWVYIGNNMKMVCRSYKKLLGRYPSWGRTEEKKSYKGNVFCCDPLMLKQSSTTPTWSDAFKVCQKNGKRLCSTTEYCPDGKHKPPVGGVLNSAMWVPVNDRTDEWVSVGWSFPKKLLCRTHTSIATRTPNWSKSAASGPKRGAIMCCDDKFINLKGSIKYSEGRLMCQKMGKRLCTIKEYCKDGEGHPPDGGSRHSLSAWAPVGDGPNMWVGVGSRKEELCVSFSKLNKRKPVWGEKEGTRGYVRCCKGKGPSPPAPKPKLKGAGQPVPVVDNMEPRAVTAEKEAKIKKQKRRNRSERHRKLKEKHSKTIAELRQKGKHLKYLQSRMLEKKAKRRLSHETAHKRDMAKLKALKQRRLYQATIERAAKERDATINAARAKSRAKHFKVDTEQTHLNLAYTKQMQTAMKQVSKQTTDAIMKAQAIMDTANAQQLKKKPWVDRSELPVEPKYYPMGGSKYRHSERLKRPGGLEGRISSGGGGGGPMTDVKKYAPKQ